MDWFCNVEAVFKISPRIINKLWAHVDMWLEIFLLEDIRKQARFLNKGALRQEICRWYLFSSFSAARILSFRKGHRDLGIPAFKISGAHVAHAYVPRRREHTAVSWPIGGLWRVFHNNHQTSKWWSLKLWFSHVVLFPWAPSASFESFENNFSVKVLLLQQSHLNCVSDLSLFGVWFATFQSLLSQVSSIK